jgi:hypothetical protein
VFLWGLSISLTTFLISSNFWGAFWNCATSSGYVVVLPFSIAISRIGDSAKVTIQLFSFYIPQSVQFVKMLANGPFVFGCQSSCLLLFCLKTSVNSSSIAIVFAILRDMVRDQYLQGFEHRQVRNIRLPKTVMSVVYFID